MSPARTALGALALLIAVSGCTDRRPENRQHKTTHETSVADSTTPLALMTPSEHEALREQLTKEGRYDCCTKPGCTECLKTPGECDCQADLRRNDPICGECLDGYREGRGKLKLVSIVQLEKIRQEKLKHKGN